MVKPTYPKAEFDILCLLEQLIDVCFNIKLSPLLNAKHVLKLKGPITLAYTLAFVITVK